MLVLASHSPRRREILTSSGIEFTTRTAAVDETPLDEEAAREHVLRLARAKAVAVAMAPGETILAADTVVVVDGAIFGKPEDGEHARWMLRRLSGREHEVVTGVCLRTVEKTVTEAESTKVRFVALSEQDIAAYVASGEPMDKAGAYAIQGLAAKYVDRIEGCYFNVVGLPVALVYKMLKAL